MFRLLISGICLSALATAGCSSAESPDNSNSGGNHSGGSASGGHSTGAAPGSGGAIGDASASGGTGAGQTGGTGGSPGSGGGPGSGGNPGAGGSSGSGDGGDGGTSSGGSGGDSGNPEILEPAAGALIGLYYGDESIADTEEKLGRALPLHLTYYDFEHNWNGGVTQEDLEAGRIPFVNWEIFSASLDDILAGDYDAMLDDRAADAKALGKKFFIDFGAEMNGEWSPWSGAQNGESADKYVATYRYVHDALAAADNLIWVWCPNVTDEPREAWNQAMNYYPGDDYVDWTCVDGYNWGDAGGAGWQSFEEVFEDIYPKLAAKNKPIMIGEMASAEVGGDKAAFIAGIVPTLSEQYPLFKGLIWFDIDKETDWRISSSPAAEAAFVDLVNDPYFNP